MDEISRLVLEGCSDEQLLARLEQGTGEEQRDEDQEFVSCIKINGNPILPPVMTPELRVQCLAWREKAVLKEKELKERRKYNHETRIKYAINDFKNKLSTQGAISSSCPELLYLDLGESEDESSDLSVSDLEPKSFAEIHQILKEQRTSELNSARSSSLSSDSVQTHPTKPYESQLYSDTELDIETNLGLYDSLQSLNTVIENPSSRLTHPSVPSSGSISSSSSYQLDDSDKENTDISTDISDSFRPRRGSYTLDKPSPLLRAHLEKFGTTQNHEYHDMSNHQRTPSPKKSPIVWESKKSRKSQEERQIILDKYLESLTEKSTPMSRIPVKINTPKSQKKSTNHFQVRSTLVETKQSSLVRSSTFTHRSEKEGVMLDRKRFQDSPKTSPSKPPSFPVPRVDQIFPVFSQSVLRSPRPSIPTSPTHSFSTSVAPTPTPTRSLTTSGAPTPSIPFSPCPTLSFSTSYAPTPSTLMSPDPTTTTTSARIRRFESPTPEPPDTSRTEILDTPTQEYTVTQSVENITHTLENTPMAEPPLLSGSVGPTDIEKAVSNLTQFHYERMSSLLARQEEERQRLKLEFEMKQQELIDQIVKQFPNLKLQLSVPSTEPRPETDQTSSIHPHTETGLKTTEKSKSPDYKPEPVQKSAGMISPNFENPSLTSQITKPQVSPDVTPLPVETQKREVVRELHPFHTKKELHIPPAVYSEKYAQGWTKLSALARGFLVRRLLRTEKVQVLKQTIRETLEFAIQLHLEGGEPSRQDVDLHSRLLAQLESACDMIHHLFFELGTPEKLEIIHQDREAARVKANKQESIKEKRLSAATRSRLESKTKESLVTPKPTDRWQTPRRKLSRARSVSRERRRPTNTVPSPYARSLSKSVSSKTGFKLGGKKSFDKPVWK